MKLHRTASFGHAWKRFASRTTQHKPEIDMRLTVRSLSSSVKSCSSVLLRQEGGRILREIRPPKNCGDGGKIANRSNGQTKFVWPLLLFANFP
eukprot:3157508-Rhodomonas_salina.1